MASLAKLKAGDVLYDVHSQRMGNTTLRTVGCWPVRIVEVYERGALASWNSNPPIFYSEHSLKKLRVKKPLLVRAGMSGRYRLATRAEVEAATA